MRRPNGFTLRPLEAHAPAALLLLFSGGSGTFGEGTQGSWALAGHLALLTFVALFGSLRPDPLRLGRAGNGLLAAFAVVLVASHLTSPVPRSGRLALLLVPAFLLVPSAVVRCWSRAEARRAGLRSLSLVVVGVAGWSLLAWWRFDMPGTSMPLGHHNLLAAWLLVLLPLAVLPWRDGGLGRAGAVLAGLLGGGSLLATRSLGAVLAIVLIGSVAVGVALGLTLRQRLVNGVALRSRRRGVLYGAVGALVAAGLLASQIQRLGAIVAGADFSVRGRLGYLEAGWRGLLERPALGWGPGSASWTISEHFRPTPGIHPPDQVVADLHCLPLQMAYELGLGGFLLVCGLFWVFLHQRTAVCSDGALRRHALSGLAAVAVMSFTGLPLEVSAVPLAAAIAVGAVCAAESSPKRVGSRWETTLLIAVIAGFVLPLDLAHLDYDRALTAETAGDRLRHLRRAVDRDPSFPLYRARLAWLAGAEQPEDPVWARQARDAARAARAIAPLWLAAGIRGQEAGEPWSREALFHACQASPLGALAPFYLTLEVSSEDERRQWMARALLAEPALLAASRWREAGANVAAAVTLLRQTNGVEAWWSEALAQFQQAITETASTDESLRSLALRMDGESSPVSRYAFRRQPWPVYLVRVEVFADDVAQIDLAGASRMHETPGVLFSGPQCTLAD